MQSVKVTDDFETSIRLISKPSFGYQGITPNTPITFQVNILDKEYSKYTMSIYAGGSRSLPFTVDSTTIWSHLKPRWRFLDRTLSPIDYEAPIRFTSEVVNDGGSVIGAIGEVVLYYVDDLPTTFINTDGTVKNSPVLLWFSIGDRATTAIKSVLSYIVKPIKPSILKISHDGMTKMLDAYTAGYPIPTYFTIHGTHPDYPDQLPIIYDTPNRDNPQIVGNRSIEDIITIWDRDNIPVNDIELDITFSVQGDD